MFNRNKKSIHNCRIYVCPNYQVAGANIPEYAESHQCDPDFIERSNRAIMDRDSDEVLSRGRYSDDDEWIGPDK